MNHLTERAAPECLLGLLEFLDASALSQLRRTAKLLGSGGDPRCVLSTNLAHMSKVAELRTVVLELLCKTKFPFVHAAYVLGLNGPYFSFDTTAEKHYGIPSNLPKLLCKLVRLEVPDLEFTTLRIQKFSSSSNFNGNHRTLPINLSSPPLPVDEGNEEATTELDDDSEAPAYVLCLTEGCRGGFGEMCREDGASVTEDETPLRRAWRPLTTPSVGIGAARWASFPVDTWLRWYWPTSGDYYAVTASREPKRHCLTLRPSQRRELTQIGFNLPSITYVKEEYEDPGCASSDESPQGLPAALSPTVDSDSDATPLVQRRRRFGNQPMSTARLTAAKRLLELSNEEGRLPTSQEIDHAYRKAVRRAHPDAQQASAPQLGAGWAMSQLSWARSVLHEALEAVGIDEADEPSAENLPQLIVGAGQAELVLQLPAPY